MSCVIIFVCHDNLTIDSVLKNTFDHYIIFVGNKELNENHRQNSKIIIARELTNNIEIEWNLLTFTAWYAIIKNNLFIDYDYLCILEYDVILNNFETTLHNRCKENPDIISFIPSGANTLLYDINYSVCIDYLIHQKMSKQDFHNVTIWGCTTNHCMKRSIVEDFVNWYYPSCLFIKDKHFAKLGYYHERLFAIYCFYKKYNHVFINGILRHLQLISHKT
jgi:hypothetical protein